MKLRNKKTGEAVYVDFQIPLCNHDETLGSYSVTSLETLNKSFEDYDPKEPLIKDKKIRKAIRAWAEANGFLNDIEVHSLTAGTRFSIENYDIEFLGYFIYDLEGNKTYTIAELCGEEEE